MRLAGERYARISWLAGDLSSALATLDEAVGLVRGQPVTADVAKVVASLAGMLVLKDRNARAVALEGLEWTRTRGLWRMQGSFLEGNAAAALVDLGRWDEALALLDLHDRRITEGVALLNHAVTAGQLAVRTGRLGDARTHIEPTMEAVASLGDAQFTGPVIVSAVELAIADGLLDEAMRLVDEGLGVLAAQAVRHPEPAHPRRRAAAVARPGPAHDDRDAGLYAPTGYRLPAPDTALRAFRHEIELRLNDPELALVDVRSPAEFKGEVIAPPGMTETAQRAGHIPGAASIPWGQAVREDGRFRDAGELRDLYERNGITADRDVVTYCRIGERSSHSWFVLHELLGYPRVRNYDGSWTEWGSMVGVPIEKSVPVGVG